MNKYIKYVVESFFDDIEDDIIDSNNGMDSIYLIKIIEDWCEKIKYYPVDIYAKPNGEIVCDFSDSYFGDVIGSLERSDDMNDMFSDWTIDVYNKCIIFTP